MDTKEVWSNQLAKPGEKLPVYSVAFHPDGSRCAVSVGKRILVYNTSDGELLRSLKGHKDNVYSISYSKDGRHFASGGADNSTIVWADEGKGVLKFYHNESVQVVAYNPRLDILASCSNSDFGFWAPEIKSVPKFRVNAKVLSASWTNDGEMIAIGMASGVVTLRDRRGNERNSISRSAPVWSLQWRPESFGSQEITDVLVIGCWDQTLSFYDLSGSPIYEECKLTCCPCDVSFYGETGEYILVADSDRRVSIFSREGTKLCDLLHIPDWIWIAKGCPGQRSIVVTDQCGKISLQSIEFDAICSQHHGRLAYRDRLTDVTVQDLINSQTIRIPCNDFVQNISLHKGNLAVQASNSILLFEAERSHPHDVMQHEHGMQREHGMQYEYKDCLLNLTDGCEVMLVLSRNLILCQNSRLQLLDFQGTSVREWILDSEVCCLKPSGGPPGGESILVGLRSGEVVSIYIDNLFPVYVVRHSAPVRSLDANANRSKVAVVDKQDCLVVFDVVTKEIILHENIVENAKFHNDLDNLLCFCCDGTVIVRDIQASTCVRIPGGSRDIVDFRGSRVICLNGQSIKTIDVQLSPIVSHFVEVGEFSRAFKIACAGVNDSVWTKLGHDALDAMSLGVAKASFSHAKDGTFMDLITTTESLLNQHANDQSALEKTKSSFYAEVALLRGQYEKATKEFVKAGEISKAIDVFVSLRKWDQAKAIAVDANMDTLPILQEQARWAEEKGDWKDAVDAYVSCSDHTKAIGLIGSFKEENWEEDMISIARKLAANETSALGACASYFSEANMEGYAKEVYTKMGDVRGLLQLYIRHSRWVEVAGLYQDHQDDFREGDLLPYAKYLAGQGRFEEAFHIFRQTGSIEQGQRLFRSLSKNAVIEGRFKDASHYHWFLASESNKSEENVEIHSVSMKLSRLYAVYYYVDEYCSDMFTSLQQESLFQAARYLVHLLDPANIPDGISLVNVLDTLAKQAKHFEAIEVAKFAYQRLLKLDIKPSLRDRIELDMRTIQAMPIQDTTHADFRPVCFQCGETNEMILPLGDCCFNCGHPFIRCFANFDVIPLVQFVPKDGIPDDDAIALIQAEEEEEEGYDYFTDSLNSALTTQVTEKRIFVSVNKTTLRSLRRDEVFALRPSAVHSKWRFFKNVIPDIGIAVCHECQNFFHEQDYEFLVLKEGGCPVCQNVCSGDYGHL